MSPLITTAAPRPKVHFVNPTSPFPAPPYTNWASAAHTIQDAVDVARAGETVLVTNGLYATGGGSASVRSLSNRVYATEAIRIVSVNGYKHTTIQGASDPVGWSGHGASAVRGVYLAPGALLGGFTVTDGRTFGPAGGLNDHKRGGGIFCADDTATVTDCRVQNNAAQFYGGGGFGGYWVDSLVKGNTSSNGGGVAEARLHATDLYQNHAYDRGGGAWQGGLTNCTLYGNTAVHRGGGAQDASLTDCILDRNEARLGGGMHFGDATDCTFKRNVAGDGGGIYSLSATGGTFTENVATNRGGGASYSVVDDAEFTRNRALHGAGLYDGRASNCLFQANAAHQGGGVARTDCYDVILLCNTASFGGGISNGTIDRSLIQGNVASTNGGGAHFSVLSRCLVISNRAARGGGMIYHHATNTLFAWNTASWDGGGVYDGNLYHCTVVGNSAVSQGGGIFEGFFQNSIIYHNQGDAIGSNWIDSTYAYSCSAPLPGSSNTDHPPGFAAWMDGNFALTDASPCLDAAPVITPLDLDGVPRPLDGDHNGSAGPFGADMGCLEFMHPRGDTDGDGMWDAWEWTHRLVATNAADGPLHSDLDPFTNVEEFLADTDPRDKDAYLRIRAIDRREGKTIYVDTSTNRVYTLDRHLGDQWIPHTQHNRKPGTGPGQAMPDHDNLAQPAHYRVRAGLP